MEINCPDAPQEPIYDNSLNPPKLIGFKSYHVPLSTVETIIIDGKEPMLQLNTVSIVENQCN